MKKDGEEKEKNESEII